MAGYFAVSMVSFEASCLILELRKDWSIGFSSFGAALISALAYTASTDAGA